ncbi:MAG TPA: hypothetical protein EYP14_11215, partial [Planctomycetaceae bacterium]|nr:hypothetical protein [Planctomycetaceae bacterium]
GGQFIQVLGGPNSLAVFEEAPISKRVLMEADVVVRRVVGKSWKIAAVAVYLDARNFWHFALVEAPDGGGRKHFVELCEMRNGQWLSQRNLKVVLDQRPAREWKTGQRYGLHISLDPQGVEGWLTDAQGRVLYKKRYAFTGPAVKVGKPALRCGGFRAQYSNVRAVYSEPATLASSEFPPYTCPSFVADVLGKRTGFFHVERRGTVWWAIDPLGRGFVPLGVDHVKFRGHWCEKLGYAPYGRKNERKYPDREAWNRETIQRLRSWGFNLLGGGCSRELFHRGLAHTRFVGIGGRMSNMGDEFDITPGEGRPCTAFPNVFHPDFESFCLYRARQVCGPYVGDPWLFGYFLDNELAWWGRGDLDTGLFDAVMKKSATHPAKQALRRFLAERYGGDIRKFNRAWGAALESFDDVSKRDAISGSNASTVAADKKSFLALIADRYFRLTTRAIRTVDPSHMILGCRFAGGHASDVVWQAAGRYCDIITLNYYGSVDLNRELALGGTRARKSEPLPDVFE